MARQRKKSVRGGGSVFLRKDGRWEAKFKVEETGRYKSLYGATEKEAYKLLEDAKYRQKQGTLATGHDQTLKQFLEYWLEDVEKPAVRLSTYVGNKVVIYKHLIPGLGHIHLQKLMASQLQSFYSRKLKEGTAASRIVRFNAVLHKALDHARRIKLVGINVSEDVQLPKPLEYEPQFLSPEQAQVFLRQVKEHKLEVLLTLAISTAMRKGEILGLKWSDIDFEDGVLSIRRTLYYIAGHGFVEGEPKTPKSKRKIVLPGFVVEMLQYHKRVQGEKRLLVGSMWVERDLVFSNKWGDYVFSTTLWGQFSRFLKKAGLSHMHFHDLRHSSATLLISMGVPEKVVQEILGHTNGAQTGKYIHAASSMQKEAMEKMNEFFKKG